MSKEVISDKQGVSLVFLFIIGESSILVSGLTAKKDLWLAIILAIFMALPLILVYSRLFNIFPNENLFNVIEICFGKIIGKVLILLYIWYAFDLAALVLRDFGQFVNTVTLTDTPMIVPMIFLIILCAWITKEGIEVISRWGQFFL